MIIELQSQYPCHGGAFFWVNLDDTNGEWSRQVNQAQSLNRGCTISAGVGPTPPPVAFPVSVPVTIPVPSFPIPVSPVSLPLTPIATPTNSVPSFPSPVSPVSLPLTPTATPTNSIPPAVSLPSENLPTFPETSPSPQPTGPTTPSTSSPFSMISTGTRPVGNNPNEPNFFDPNNSRSSAFASSQAPFFVLFVAMPTWALVIF